MFHTLFGCCILFILSFTISPCIHSQKHSVFKRQAQRECCLQLFVFLKAKESLTITQF